ncbi:AlpA family transcriptional regulator [Pseudomonas sp. C27(2019)]|uniref:helix-turn-helix transcriptional regulator n=1 Tax=Pseudomonas sp. C27(2019) TaxID=2604941 RepID=UPI001248EA68|nr:AlpA family transcriptional regulator [Pseudomonas sp. C27(2019)]QEY59911.1 AlpA family transcriptional regulator [Pseudomonas sp. C27(2019)]
MKLLKMRDVMALTSLAKSTIYKYIDTEGFPKQVKLGSGSVAWVEGEVLDWIEAKIAQRDAPIMERGSA